MTTRSPLEKQRDILGMFVIEKAQFTDFVAKVYYSQVPAEHRTRLAEESLESPRIRWKQAGEVALSENYIKEEQHLSRDETRMYVAFFLDKGYMVRDAEGNLEITQAGIQYYDELKIDLQRATVKSLSEVYRFSQRRRKSDVTLL